MDHAPVNWRDIALHNDNERDLAYRRAMIEAGIFHFPVATKQSSISLAHTDADIDETVAITADVIGRLG
jgi:glutamate-1-semialdehyde 2,1-aminomutase